MSSVPRRFVGGGFAGVGGLSRLSPLRCLGRCFLLPRPWLTLSQHRRGRISRSLQPKRLSLKRQQTKPSSQGANLRCLQQSRLNLKSQRGSRRKSQSRLQQSRLNLKRQGANPCRQRLPPRRLCLRNPQSSGNRRHLHLRRLLGLLWGRIGLGGLTLLITSPAAP